MKLRDNARFSTICIHAGQEPDPSTGAIITPIYQTSTYVQDGLGQHKGYEYGRTQNPTRIGARGATSPRSRAARPPSRSPRAWRPSARVLTRLAVRRPRASSPTTPTAAPSGCSSRCCRKFSSTSPTSTPRSSTPIEPAIRPNTKMLFLETPTNPMLRITDLAAACDDRARARTCAVVVDNTFASPYVQRPLDARRRHRAAQHHQVPERPQRQRRRRRRSPCSDDHVEWLRFVQNAEGAILGPMDAWLVLRGTKTLPIRMERTQRQRAWRSRSSWRRTRRSRASTIPGCRRIRSTRWPSGRCSGFGGLISFDARLARARADACSNSVRLMALAESLGGVETLISHPAIDDARVGAGRAARSSSASPTAWSASRSASRTSTTCRTTCAGARRDLMDQLDGLHRAVLLAPSTTSPS